MQKDQFKYEYRDPKNRKLRWDATDVIYQEMEYRAQKGWNFVSDVYGDPGIGKSSLAIGLYEKWKEIVKKLGFERKPRLFTTFSRWQTAQVTKQAKKYDLIVQDEDTLLSGSGSRTSEDALSNILSIIRQEQICFIFVGPKEKTLNVVNFSFEVVLQNEQERKNLVKVYNHKARLVGRAELPILRDKELEAEYLRRKTENIERIKQSQGRDSEILDPAQLEQDMQTVLEHSREQGWDLKNKKRITVACRLAGIAGQKDYIDYLTTFIDMMMDSLEDIGTVVSMKRKEKNLVLYPGSIVDKYRQSIESWSLENDLETAYRDLESNHFLNKSYSDIAAARDVGKNTISSNIKRAKRKLDKVSGLFWEQAIFSWMLEQLQQIAAATKDLQLVQLVNGQEVDSFPVHTDEDIFFLVLAERTSRKALEKTFSQMSFPNPPTAVFLPLLQDLQVPFVFLWQGGKSTVDFLLLSGPGFQSRSTIDLVVFDAKVSHQCYDGKNREISSHTVSLEKLLPQSQFLIDHPDSSAAILFWSPRIGPKYHLQAGPERSVTINRSSPDLEQSLFQYLVHNKDQEKNTKAQKTSKKKPSKEVRAEK